jgi:hypothetical protein
MATSVYDSDGNLVTSGGSPGVVSTLNSTHAPLGIAGVFTGGWEEVTNYAVISLSVISDQSSAPEGLVFQWSGDGVNVDRSEPSGLVGGVQGRAFSMSVRARFFRVVYTNGGVAQTVFRLSTVLRPNGYGHISKPLSQTATDDNFAELVQSPVMGRTADGVFRNIGAVFTPGNELAIQTVSHNRLAYEVANERVFGVSVDFNLPSNGNETAAVLLRNPLGSGKHIYVTDGVFHSNVNAQAARVRMSYAPTVTATGTPATVVSPHVGGSAVTAMQVFVGPTVSSFGTVLRNVNTGFGGQSASVQVDFRMATIVNPGKDLLISGVPTANNVVVTINFFWLEAV